MLVNTGFQLIKGINMKISVVLASYNGEKYIKEQLDSICPYLEVEDELLVSDDGSTDNTLNLVRDYQERYSNIKITDGNHSGSSSNFASAIPKCSGDIVLFCDQDDIWMPQKIKVTKDFFLSNPSIDLVMHNAGFCDENGNIFAGDIFDKRNPKTGFIHNLIHSSYYGCCMMAKRDFLMKCIPLPDNKIPYDQYFSLLAEKRHKAMFLNEKLILHRYHGNNQSRKMSNIERLKFRMRLLKSVRSTLRSHS